MKQMSTGDDATLGNYLKMAKLFFGDDSIAVDFLNEEIAKSPNGENEEVIAAESQMVYLLTTKHMKGT